MAIYSLHHSSIGRTTHAPGTAGAHLSYITRSSACREIVGARMPLACVGRKGGPARAWIDAEEARERKNGRVGDKIMVALPRELSPEQQATLIRAFAEEITQGRASWLAALHDLEGPNPHAHVFVRDKDPETGRRVVGLSERGSTDRLRAAWERYANAALAAAGAEARIDRRTLAAQGVAQVPTVHVGPAGTAMARRGETPRSKERRDRRGRVMRWPEIDRGRSRVARNEKILADRETRAGHVTSSIEGDWNDDHRRRLDNLARRAGAAAGSDRCAGSTDADITAAVESLRGALLSIRSHHSRAIEAYTGFRERTRHLVDYIGEQVGRIYTNVMSGYSLGKRPSGLEM